MQFSETIQVFLLHFAGGNLYSYKFLAPHFPSRFEVHALELPGRGKRFSEKFLLNKIDAATDYREQIERLRQKEFPFIIYGHSMGAQLGLLLAKQLEEAGDEPLSLIVSGNAWTWHQEKIRRKSSSDGRSGFSKRTVEFWRCQSGNAGE